MRPTRSRVFGDHIHLCRMILSKDIALEDLSEKINLTVSTRNAEGSNDSYGRSDGNWSLAITPLHVLRGSFPESCGSLSTLAPRQITTASYSSAHSHWKLEQR